jgi:lipopolysaccharide assembly outer membrane protein LptD (OstA)
MILAVVFSGASLEGARRDKLELVQANEMSSFSRNGVTYRRVSGDVILKRGEATLSCQVAEFQVERDEARLDGQVKITTKDAILSGKQAFYFGDREYVEMVGDARFIDEPFLVRAGKLGYYIDLKKVIASEGPSLVDSSSTLSADSIYYYEKNKLGDARGEAVLYNPADSLSVFGDQLLYYSGKDSLLSYGDAKLINWSATDTTLKIFSDSLSLEEGFFFAWQNVRLINGDTEGTCGQAVYMQEDDVAIMREDPVLTDSEFVLTGDVFNLHMEDGDLSSVLVPENPHFTQSKQVGDSSYTDWLDGKVMAVDFQNKQPKKVTLIEMATSYFNLIEDGVFKGANNVSGDTLVILLSDSSISEINVTGGAQGKFSPADASQDVDFPINYQANLINYSMADEPTLLKKNAAINYGDMAMTSGQIGVFWRKNLLRAKSLVDTAGAKDTPVLKQKGHDDFRGEAMVYDLKTQRGKVEAGRTKMEDGNYFGEKVTRVNEDVFLMEDGYYTTCDLEEDPHFYFYSKHMKLLTDKIIIARPIVFYIADIPLLALPYAVFPQQKGRSSGFILPSYDYRPNNGGRALKGFGYYWAINDYSDFKLTGDFWDQYEEFSLRSVLRYKKRYSINGGFDASMASDRPGLGEPATWRWKLNFRHSQTINPTLSISANGNLSGDANFDRTYSHSQSERLNTKLRSGVLVNKTFEETKSKLTIGGNYDENLQVTRKVQAAPEAAGVKLTGPTLRAPSMTFNKPSAAIFKTTGTQTKWYNSFRWSYNNNFKTTRRWSYLSYVNSDTSSEDSLLWEKTIDDTRTWRHNLSLSGNTQIMDVFKVVGSVSYADAWAFRYNEALFDEFSTVRLDSSSGAVLTNEVDGFIRRGTFSTSASLNTKLYGIIPVKLAGLQAIRHTLTPSVSLRYSPNFSDDIWGYTETYIDSAGNEVIFDRFNGSDIGPTPDNETLNMSYGINNVFDYKLVRGKEERKGQFFTWNLSGSYNFKKDSLKASDIRNTFKINLGKNFTLSPSANFEIYERDSTGSKKINKFRSPRMTRANFNFSFNLSGAPSGGLRQNAFSKEFEGAEADTLQAIVNRPDVERASGSKGSKKPVWTAGFRISYSYSHDNPTLESKQTFNMRASLKFNLSENWGIT